MSILTENLQRPHPPAESDGPTRVEQAVERAKRALLDEQHADGYWCFELEADCTIPSEYVLLMHYMDDIDAQLQAKIAVYVRARQQAQGGWPLYFGGEMDLSCSVKAYYALKLAGDSPDAPHMVRAREAILSRGGAARCNVFTRITLALFAQVPWRAAPFIAVEAMLLPKWFPFHTGKVSYWSRTVMVPLLVLCSFKPRARNPRNVHIAELFAVPAEQERHYFQSRSALSALFLKLDRIGLWLEPLIPGWIRRIAIERAQRWFTERLNGYGGLGGIFPAMVNVYEAMDCLGYPADHPQRQVAREALRRLVVVGEESAYCQPCVSPVWDTGLACLALQEIPGSEHAVGRALDWLQERQLLEEAGDWKDARPDVEGGGWPFQFENNHYPDVDDTSVVAWAMHAAAEPKYDEAVRRATDWICGMQSRNGGYGAFDADNAHYYLNEIPFADHGALLDPPTVDVSARCAALLARTLHLDLSRKATLDSCMRYIFGEQEPDGAWFGRWGTNYIYGTWSVLSAFEQVGVPPTNPAVQRAAAWLKQVQRADGGWGEDNESYLRPADGRSGQTQHFVPNGVGLARVDRGRRRAIERGPPRGRVPAAHPAARRFLERRRLHLPGFSARVLSEVSRLQQILSALGARALPAGRGGGCMTRVGVVIAMASEVPSFSGQTPLAGIVTPQDGGDLLILSGIGAERAQSAAQRLLQHGATALLSWGSAAALDARLRPGHIVLPNAIVGTDGVRLSVDLDWQQPVRQCLADKVPVSSAAVAESRGVLKGTADKAALAYKSGAGAADMESASVARVAQSAGVPFLAVRAIADSLGMAVPAWLLQRLDLLGKPPVKALCIGLARNPADILTLARLARAFRAAMQALASVKTYAAAELQRPQ